MGKHQWKKDFDPNDLIDRDFAFFGVIAFIIIGLFIQEPILYILITYLMINFFYNRTIGTRLILKSKQQTIRLFQGDEAEFTFLFENRSILPIIYGTFSFQTEFIIRPLTGVKFLEEILTVQKSFPIRSKGYTIATFPFALKSRGVAKIRNITYAFPH